MREAKGGTRRGGKNQEVMNRVKERREAMRGPKKHTDEGVKKVRSQLQERRKKWGQREESGKTYIK